MPNRLSLKRPQREEERHLRERRHRRRSIAAHTRVRVPPRIVRCSSRYEVSPQPNALTAMWCDSSFQTSPWNAQRRNGARVRCEDPQDAQRHHPIPAGAPLPERWSCG